MKKRIWLTVLTALVFTTSGCESETNEVPSQPPAERQTELTIEAPAEEEEAVEEDATAEPVEETEAAAPAEPDETAAEVEPDEEFPAQVAFEGSFGQVTFDHEAHVAINPDCASCHDTDPPGKIALGRENAHELCIGCHQEVGAGPTRCNECHVRD